jgi:hypothetical protein
VPSYTFPSTVIPNEGISKPEAADVLSALFKRTPVKSPTCNNGCIAIDTYPEIINHRRRGPEFWIIHSGHVLLFIDQTITCAGECEVVGQSSHESLRVPLDPSLRHVVL